jgi:hypothetical protein
MDEKQEIEFFHASIQAALEMKDTLGDMEEYVKLFRGCFKNGWAGLSDLDVIFVAGYVASAQVMVEGMAEELKEAERREMFRVRDAGQA